MPPRPRARRQPTGAKVFKFDDHPRTVQKVRQAERGVFDALASVEEALRLDVVARLVEHQVLTERAQRALFQALLALAPLSPADRTALLEQVAKRSKIR